MFDSNQMRELAAIKADRYQRAGGGGGGKIYTSSRAYYEARGEKELSAWDRLMLETKTRWQQSCAIATEHYRMTCLIDREGFYHGESIPF